MKNKKLLIAAGICLFLCIFEMVDWSYQNWHSFDTEVIMRCIIFISQCASILCVFGAFTYDSLRKRRKAIACAAVCLGDVLLRSLIPNWVYYNLYFLHGNLFWNLQNLLYRNIDSVILWFILRFFLQILSAIPDVLLLIFVMSKKRSQKKWITIGIVMISLTICNDYISGYYGHLLENTMELIWKYRINNYVVLFVASIPFGLLYLFGFMGDTQIIIKKNRKTSYTSYLEQYKQEHGLK